MFCINCGERLIENARFCAKCGQPVHVKHQRRTVEQNATNEMCVLTVFRANQFYVINPPIKIDVDNQKQYTVENGESVCIPISKGMHRITFTVTIAKKIVDINITEDASMVLKMSRLTGDIIVN